MNTSISIKDSLTKKEVKELAVELSRQDKNPLLSWVRLSRFQDFVKFAKEEIKTEVKQIVRDNEEDENQTIVDGVGLTVQPGRTTWDFSHCQEWLDLKERIKEIEGNMKKVALTPGIYLVNAETGEEYQPAIMKIAEPFIKNKY